MKLKKPVPVKEETILYNVDPVVPSAYIEKPPFPVRIRNMLKFQLWLTKAMLEHLNLMNKLK